jgi:hypothetical protein
LDPVPFLPDQFLFPENWLVPVVVRGVNPFRFPAKREVDEKCLVLPELMAGRLTEARDVEPERAKP